mgnify:CR=1 FL=1
MVALPQMAPGENRLAGMEPISTRLLAGGFLNYYLAPDWRLIGSLLYGAGNDRDGARLDLGVRYLTEVGGRLLTLRARVDNVFDKFYWRDVTQQLGGYLLPGAPRTFRISGQFDF